MTGLMKRMTSRVVGTVGSALPSEALQDWLLQKVCRRLLDERAIPNAVTPRPMRGMKGRVLCNPYWFVHRRPYWFGRLHELHVDNMMRRLLRQGDTFIDVGASYGQMTALAASLVGPTGHVYAFEPEKGRAGAVATFMTEEKLSQVKVFAVGLGQERKSSQLYHSSLADAADVRGMADHKPVDVEIEVGDEVLAKEALTGRIVLKVDTEGYEMQVLRGMKQTLQKVDYVVVEVSPEWVGGVAGVGAMFDLMADAGLTPYMLEHSGKAGKKLVPADVTQQFDVIFCRGNAT